MNHARFGRVPNGRIWGLIFMILRELDSIARSKVSDYLDQVCDITLNAAVIITDIDVLTVCTLNVFRWKGSYFLIMDP